MANDQSRLNAHSKSYSARIPSLVAHRRYNPPTSKPDASRSRRAGRRVRNRLAARRMCGGPNRVARFSRNTGPRVAQSLEHRGDLQSGRQIETLRHDILVLPSE
jgi:hypothetical protein